MKFQRINWLFFLCLFLGISGCKKGDEVMVTQSSTSEHLVEQKKLSTTKEKETVMTSSTKQVKYENGSLLQATQNNDVAQIKNILQTTDYPINEVNEKKETPLLVATHHNFIEAAKLLMDAGADINQQDEIQDSAYLYAGAQGKTEILAYMLKQGHPNQAVVNRFGGNALIPAAEKGHLENVRLLLKDGRANINHQNNYGYTALIEAVALRDGSQVYQQIVKELLAHGADKTLRDNTGRTAMDYAKELGYSNMQELLK